MSKALADQIKSRLTVTHNPTTHSLNLDNKTIAWASPADGEKWILKDNKTVYEIAWSWRGIHYVRQIDPLATPTKGETERKQGAK